MSGGLSVELHVSAVARDRRLVAEVLRLPVILEKTGFVEFSASGGSLMLWQAPRGNGPGTAAARGVGVEIVLGVDDLAHTLYRAAFAGCRVGHPTWKPWGRLEGSIWLPDGYELRLFARPVDLDDDP